jgi:hypothetical protein
MASLCLDSRQWEIICEWKRLYRRYEMDDFIRKASTEQLWAELQRREREAEMPKLLDNYDWTQTIHTMVNAVANRARGKSTKDLDYWIFEAVAEALYGKAIWGWWNIQEVDDE